MKHTILILTLLLLSLSGSAQWPFAFESTTMSVNPTEFQRDGIIRAWKDDYVVVSNKDALGDYYIMAYKANDVVNHTSASSAIVKMLSGFVLNDLQVHGDNVYFCGSSNNTQGVLGWFDLNDLIGTAPFFGYGIQLPQSMATHLNKLAVYAGTDGETFIAALGDTSAYNTKRSDRLFEWSGSTQFTDADWCILTAPTLNVVSYDDIKATDDFVVIAGRCSEPAPSIAGGLILRRYKKGNLQNGLLDDYYFYPHLACPAEPVKSTHLKSNLLGVAVDFHLQPWQTSIYTIDIVTMGMLNNQDIPVAAKSRALDLVYSNALGYLILSLEHAYTPSHQVSGELIFINPLATSPYTADFLYDASYPRITSLAVAYQRMLYAIDGYRILLREAQYLPSTVTNPCYAASNITINPTSIFISKANTAPQTINVLPNNTLHNQLNIDIWNVTLDCAN